MRFSFCSFSWVFFLSLCSIISPSSLLFSCLVFSSLFVYCVFFMTVRTRLIQMFSFFSLPASKEPTKLGGVLEDKDTLIYLRKIQNYPISRRIYTGKGAIIIGDYSRSKITKISFISPHHQPIQCPLSRNISTLVVSRFIKRTDF